MAIHGKYSGLFARLFLLLSVSHPALAAPETISSRTSSTATSTSPNPTTSTASETNMSLVKISTIPISTSTSNPIPEMPEYTFDYPAQSWHVNTIVNYQDTIDLLWYSTYPYNPPTLSIQCWNRSTSINSTEGPPLSVKPDLQANLTTIENGNLDYVINMTVYKKYNPCQFFLVDSINASATRGVVKSATVEIQDDKNAPAKNWTADNEAPVSTAWPVSGAVSLGGGVGRLWMLAGWAGMVAMGMSLL